MTDATAPMPEPPAAPTEVAEVAWRPLPPEARNRSMLGGLLVGLLPGLPIWVLAMRFVDGWMLRLALGLDVLALGATYGAWVGYRRWVTTYWRLDARGLQVRRGKMFFREVLVPRSRVQHLDIERGPI